MHFLEGSGNFSLAYGFKTMRLTTIRNGPKQTLSTSGGLRLLQMV